METPKDSGPGPGTALPRLTTYCRGHGTSVFTLRMGRAPFFSHLQCSRQLDKTSQLHLAMRLGHEHPRGLGPSDHALDIWKTPGALTL